MKKVIGIFEKIELVIRSKRDAKKDYEYLRMTNYGAEKIFDHSNDVFVRTEISCFNALRYKLLSRRLCCVTFKGSYHYSKRVITIILVLVMCVCTSVCLSACSFEEDDADVQGVSLVIIAGRHANANMYSSKDIRNVIENLVSQSFSITKGSSGKFETSADISVIVSDSVPEITPIVDDSGSELEMSFSKNTKKSSLNDVEKTTKKIVEFLYSDNLKADDKEVDLFAALSEAKKILDSKQSKDKHILVLDTGITTAGLFNMNLIDIQQEKLEDVINAIPKEAFPDLTGIKVTFENLGNVGGQQMDMRDDNIFSKRLEELWDTLLEKCGAELTHKMRYSVSEGNAMEFYYDDSQTSYPYVTDVVFEKPVVITDSIMYSICNTRLGFKAGSAEFINEDDKNSELHPEKVLKEVSENIKEYLKVNKKGKIYVVASVAKVNNVDDFGKSDEGTKRANKVTEILYKLTGAGKDQIIPIDAGTRKFSWKNWDDWKNGKEDPVNMSNSRMVAIISDNSKETQELKDAKLIK